MPKGALLSFDGLSLSTAYDTITGRRRSGAALRGKDLELFAVLGTESVLICHWAISKGTYE